MGLAASPNHGAGCQCLGWVCRPWHSATASPGAAPTSFASSRISRWATTVANIQIDHFKTTLHILNTLQTYKYIHFKTAIHLSTEVHCGSAFGPSASWLPSYCTPPVCVPAVIWGPAVWRHNKSRQNIHVNKHTKTKYVPFSIWFGVRGPPYYCAPLVCVPDVIGVLVVWRHYRSKNKNSVTGN